MSFWFVSGLIYSLALHDALPISSRQTTPARRAAPTERPAAELAGWAGLARPRKADLEHVAVLDDVALPLEADEASRSEEHTTALQAPCNLVCRPLPGRKQIVYWL